jgi:hypothetical protein
VAHGLNPRTGKQSADSLALVFGLHGHGRKSHALYRTVLARNDGWAEEDVPDNLAIVYRDQRD